MLKRKNIPRLRKLALEMEFEIDLIDRDRVRVGVRDRVGIRDGFSVYNFTSDSALPTFFYFTALSQ